MVPLDSQGEGGLLGRGRSQANCRWVTRLLSVASSGVISSLAVLGEAILTSRALWASLSMPGISSLALLGVSSLATLLEVVLVARVHHGIHKKAKHTYLKTLMFISIDFSN